MKIGQIHKNKLLVAPEVGAPEGGRVVQYSDSWILILLMYSRQSPNFSRTRR